jgi:hypothetical protein
VYQDPVCVGKLLSSGEEKAKDVIVKWQETQIGAILAVLWSSRRES